MVNVTTEMREALSTLSNEAITSGTQKIDESSWHKAEWDIPWAETITNLTNSRDLLLALLSGDILRQIPLKIQKDLLENVKALSRYFTDLMNGSDSTQNIVNVTEELYSTIWKYRLNNLDEKFLGYETKMNQLKNLETEARKLTSELKDGLGLKDKMNQLVVNSELTISSITENLNKSQSSLLVTDENRDKTIAISLEASAKQATITENEKQVQTLLSEVKASNTEVKSLENNIKQFFAQVDVYRSTIESTSANAKNVIDGNNKQKDLIISELKEIEIEIRDRLQKATGISLFHSFDTRRENIANAKNTWFKRLLWAIGGAVILGIWIAIAHKDDVGMNIASNAFFLKLSLSIPIGFAIYFCAAQYNKERKLEEEYAFKSNISLSLSPYEEFVKGTIDSSNANEREKYTKFIIDSIANVYESPTDRVFRSDSNEIKDSSLEKMSKPITAMFKSVTDMLKEAKS